MISSKSFSSIFQNVKYIEDMREKHEIKKVNDYVFIKKIGEGSFSKVYKAFNTKEKKIYAVKVVKINSRNFHSYDLISNIGNEFHFYQHQNNGRLESNFGIYNTNSCESCSAMCLEREVRILRKINDSQQSVNNNHMIQAKEVLKSKNTVYIVLEWASHGSLQEYIDDGNLLDEQTVAAVFKQVINSVKYIHSMGICHHDIKPANILLYEHDVKLSDFGIGHSFKSTDSVVGTPAFQAPEFFQDSDDIIDPIKEDVWSIGVSLYYSLYGFLPYVGENVYEIVRRINETKLQFPSNDNISKDAKDLLKQLLTVDPNERPGLEEIQNHPFIKNASDSFTISFKRQDNEKLKKSKFSHENDEMLEHLIDSKEKSIDIEDYLPDNSSILEIKAEICGKGQSFITQTPFSYSGHSVISLQ